MNLKKLLYLVTVLRMVLIPALSTPVQADDPAPPVVRQSTWGAIKALYRQEVGQSDSASAFGVQKPGVGQFGGTYADQQWWRSLSQASRNMLILETAYRIYLERGGDASLSRVVFAGYDANGNRYTCKTWIQLAVVPRASRNVAQIPLNNGSCSWNSGAYVRATGRTVEQCTQGQIIQTRWGPGLHTAIVWARGPSGVWWIDCNYSDPYDYSLRVHYVSFSTFNSKSGGCYTVYEVTGG